MHPLSSLSIANCLAVLINHALVHASTTSPSITGAPVDPSTITGTDFTISTATDTAGGYQVGDEILSINDPTALQWLQNQQKQTCSTSKNRKRSVQCVVDFAMAGMDALSTDLQSLLTIKSVGTLAANSDLEPYVQTVFNEGRQISQLGAVPDDTLLAVSKALLLVFNNPVNLDAPIATVNIFPITEFASTTAATTAGCRVTGTTPACPDSNCSGENTKTAATCTMSGSLSGCTCIPTATPVPIMQGNASWCSIQLSVLVAATSWASMNPLPSSTSLPISTVTDASLASNPPQVVCSTVTDTSLASTPPPIVCNQYPVGSCWSPTSASDVVDAAQAFGNQLGSNIPALREGGNNYTQVYNGGKVNYILNMAWVDGCTWQKSQDPNNLMPNDPGATYDKLFIDAFTQCPVEGGYSIVGCVKIGVYANAISGVLDSPPKPSLFWENPRFCS